MRLHWVDYWHSWWTYKPQLLSLEGLLPIYNVEKQPFNFEPPIFHDDSFFMEGHERKYFIGLHMGGLVSSMILHIRLPFLHGKILQGDVPHVCNHGSYLHCESSYYSGPTP